MTVVIQPQVRPVATAPREGRSFFIHSLSRFRTRLFSGRSVVVPPGGYESGLNGTPDNFTILALTLPSDGRLRPPSKKAM